MQTVKIVSRRDSNKVLFECEVPDEIYSNSGGLDVRHTLEKAVCSGADLRDADLSGADLRDADLSGADLSGAVLRGADLSDADLSGAVLRGAFLRDADLSGADLSGADLSGADLRGAFLSGAFLGDADLSGAFLGDADLRGADGKTLRATPEESIANLDKVREIILENKERLEMGRWHGGNEWADRTCAEEAICGTTHCLAGWLQVCSTNPDIRKMDAELAGILSAPVAAKMFFREADEVIDWLESRAYATEAIAMEAA